MNMSSDALQKYIADLFEQITDIEDFTSEGYDYFMRDKKTQGAVIHAYEVIGEVVKRLPNSLLTKYPQVDWQKVKGFRDYLIHNYDKVTLKNVWDAVLNLPNLKAAVVAMQKLLTDEENSPTDPLSTYGEGK